MKNVIDNYRKSYEALLPQINANIEKYRKGHFTINVTNKDGVPVSAAITAEQKKHAFDFGTNALMLGNMGDKEQEYRDAISNLFNLVTTTFCWSSMEPTPKKFRFEEGSEEIYRRPPSDRVLSFAKENAMKGKGQPLFCGRWCPDWVPQDLDILKEKWTRYVEEVAKKYDGKYDIFDVVNESYQIRGSWKNMTWLPISFSEFTEWMLKTAGGIFSKNCILERNETTHVNYGEYGERYFHENKEFLEKGIRIDSIGFQFHFFSGKSCVEKHLSGVASPENIYATYQKMSTLGVPLYITEITIPSVYESMCIEDGEELQAEILENLYRMWFSIPAMRGIIYWNIKDGDTWKNEGDCRGCLMDEFMRKKKSYYALEHLIKREWNTCVTEKGSTSFEFSGFYGEYDVTVTDESGILKKSTVSFNENHDSVTIVL